MFPYTVDILPVAEPLLVPPRHPPSAHALVGLPAGPPRGAGPVPDAVLARRPLPAVLAQALVGLGKKTNTVCAGKQVRFDL